MNLPGLIEEQGRPWPLAAGFLLIGVVGLVDYLTGYEFSFSVFYVLPISLVTWNKSRNAGFVASLASAVAWLSADLASGHQYSQALIPLWNTLIRLAFFVIVTLLLSGLKRATEREADLARIDFLTGAVNLRMFYELLQMEIDRFQRYEHPFTVAYLDLDNFKMVNDQEGHPAGDRALQEVVNIARENIRRTDVLARLGGDEFAVLLPDTDQKTAVIVMTKLHGNLLARMKKHNWPITFSIGVLTCEEKKEDFTAKALVEKADKLMYSIKNGGKNAVKYSTCSG